MKNPAGFSTRAAVFSAVLIMLGAPVAANAFDFSGLLHSGESQILKQGTDYAAKKLPTLQLHNASGQSASGSATGGYAIADPNAFVTIANEKRQAEGLPTYSGAAAPESGTASPASTAASSPAGVSTPDGLANLQNSAGAAWHQVGGAQGLGSLATTVTGDAKWSRVGSTVNALGDIGTDKTDLQNFSNLARAVGSGVLVNKNNQDNTAAKIAFAAGTLGNAAFANDAHDVPAVYHNLGGLNGVGNAATVITGDAKYTAYGQAGAALGNVNLDDGLNTQNVGALTQAGSALILSNPHNQGSTASALATAGLLGTAATGAAGAAADGWGQASAQPVDQSDSSPYADPTYQQAKRAKRAELDNLLKDPYGNAQASAQPTATDANALITGEVVDRVGQLRPDQQAFFYDKGVKDINDSLDSMKGVTDPAQRAKGESLALQSALDSAAAIPALDSVTANPSTAGSATPMPVSTGPRIVSAANPTKVKAASSEVSAPASLPASDIHSAERIAQAQWGDLLTRH